MIDLIVAGGGPVGLMTAIHARLRGLDVTVVELRPGPIDKACGEGLMPDALARLQVVGVDPPGLDFFGIRYIAKGAVAEARFRSGPGRGGPAAIPADRTAPASARPRGRFSHWSRGRHLPG